MPKLFVAASLLTSSLVTPFVGAQIAPADPASMPRDYRGAGVRIPGIFVTPVPNAPFSAEVEIVSHDKLPDGTEHVVSTRSHIARGSSGIIHNERRRLMPASFAGEPRLLEVHLYDPSSRKSTFFIPETHLARETILPVPPAAPRDQRSPSKQSPPSSDTVETSLGTQFLDGVELRGIRKTRVVTA